MVGVVFLGDCGGESHIYSNKLRGLCRKRGVLTEENIAWLEQVFRENVGKGKEEFTLDEFKKIVPSKNVSRKVYTIMVNIRVT